MNATDSSRGYYSGLGLRPAHFPSANLPKQETSWFTWVLVAFAILTLLGVVVGFVMVADAPRPVIEMLATEQVPPPTR